MKKNSNLEKEVKIPIETTLEWMSEGGGAASGADLIAAFQRQPDGADDFGKTSRDLNPGR